jgi:thiol:disulfide interchange protein DsbD
MRIPADPLMSYGYEKEVLLLTEISPAATLTGPLTLAARVDWLECKEACLPGKGDLEILLPLAKDKPARVASVAPLFARARADLPQAGKSLSLSGEATATTLTLKAAGSSARSAYFFPSKAQIVEPGEAQKLDRDAAGLTLAMKRATDAPAFEGVSGVLELGGAAFEIEVPVKAEASAPAREAAPLATAMPVGGAAAVTTTLPVALVFAFLGGLILNLMPCVLPVLSLKVMSFVRHGGDAPGGAVRHGLAFTLGVLSFFWILAGSLVALRASGEEIGWGFQLQSPVFVVFLTNLFLLLALNLFGVFEVGASLTAVANVGAKTSGLLGSFWSGALATIVATPCTAPFMGSALGFALGQPTWVTLAVFTALGLGMSSPYIVLAASPRLLKRLPRPGRWMETFKQAMGFPMLATVVFLVWLFGRQAGVNAMTGLLGSLLLVGMGSWIYGRGGAALVGGRRIALLASAVAFVAAGLALGVTQARASTGPIAQLDAGWEPYSEERLAELRHAGTPVLVDFTADWCLTCQVNDRVALSRPAVRERLTKEGVVLMKADWTLRDEKITRALAAHGRQGVPVYALYGRDGAARLLPELLTPQIVLKALDQTF